MKKKFFRVFIPAHYRIGSKLFVTRLNLYSVYGSVIDWFVNAILAFIVLQIVRMCYVYVAFGKVLWHPFGKIENHVD